MTEVNNNEILAPVKSTSRNPNGRPKGSANKHTVAIKEAFDFVFAGMGGNQGLLEWAQKNPSDFYKMYSKMLPRYQDITSAGNAVMIGVVNYKPTEPDDNK